MSHFFEANTAILRRLGVCNQAKGTGVHLRHAQPQQLQQLCIKRQFSRISHRRRHLLGKPMERRQVRVEAGVFKLDGHLNLTG